MDVAVGLGRVTANLPANRTLVRNTAVSATALKGIVFLLRTIGPRLEQSDVTSSTASTSTESSNKVTRLDIVPRDGLSNVGETDGASTRRSGVQSHANEAGAVGAVLAALRVRVVVAHGVWDVAGDPVLTAGENLLAADLALVGGAAVAGAAAVAGLGDHAVRAGLHVVVSDVAVVGCLVPDGVAVDGFAVGLAGDLHVGAAFVCFDD